MKDDHEIRESSIEHQLPRPWEPGAELRLFQHALDQVELADRLGIDYAWEVEHHFLEEYSRFGPGGVPRRRVPSVRGASASDMRLVLIPPGYNPPARVAERVATLDSVSGGDSTGGRGNAHHGEELEGFGRKPG